MRYKDMPVYDLIGIGIGPFNLGLAAMLQGSHIRHLFLERNSKFSWHPGMMLDWTRMQVPFYADLVSLDNPASPYSYLNYLKASGGLIRHGTMENMYPLRSEYEAYCRWVAGRLPDLRFGLACVRVQYLRSEKVYRVRAMGRDQLDNYAFMTRRIVVGVGTAPYIPSAGRCSDHVFHSSVYKFRKEALLGADAILIVGSGQSAAEIVYDLLKDGGENQALTWITRSGRLYPMEQGPFAYKMSSPEYIEWFYAQSPDTKTALLKEQDPLYKGVDAELLKTIFLAMDQDSGRGHERLRIVTGQSLCHVNEETGIPEACFENMYDGSKTVYSVPKIVLATGYRFRMPAFLEGVAHLIGVDEEGYPVLQDNYAADAAITIFFQNADLRSHGFNSADLGLGPYRNRRIMDAIAQSMQSTRRRR